MCAGSGPGGLYFEVTATEPNIGVLSNSSLELTAIQVHNNIGGGIFASLAGYVNQATLMRLDGVVAVNNTVLTGGCCCPMPAALACGMLDS